MNDDLVSARTAEKCVRPVHLNLRIFLDCALYCVLSDGFSYVVRSVALAEAVFWMVANNGNAVYSR